MFPVIFPLINLPFGSLPIASRFCVYSPCFSPPPTTRPAIPPDQEASSRLAARLAAAGNAAVRVALAAQEGKEGESGEGEE